MDKQDYRLESDTRNILKAKWTITGWVLLNPSILSGVVTVLFINLVSECSQSCMLHFNSNVLYACKWECATDLIAKHCANAPPPGLLTLPLPPEIAVNGGESTTVTIVPINLCKLFFWCHTW